MSDLLVASNITLNLQRPNSNVVVYAKQYDMISRVINASLVSGSEVWDPPAGCEIVVMYTKPDGKMGIYDVADGYPEYSNQNTYEIGDRVIYGGYIYSCRVAILVPEAWNANHWNYVSTATPAVSKTGTGQIQITLAEQALNVEGNVHVEISFYQSSTRLTTLSFTISVEKGVPNDDALKSDNYFNILSGMIQNLMGASSYPPQIDPTTRNWIVWNADRLPPGPEVTEYSSVGPQGETGPVNDILATNVYYAQGDSGTVPPATGWSASFPETIPGKWTWVRRSVQYGSGDTITDEYSVYQGQDGGGSAGSQIPLKDVAGGDKGSANAYSREDHRHPIVTPADIGAVALSELIDYVYPIGSIYMSVNEVSPQTFLGGEWEQIEDRFLLAAGLTYDAGNTGGESTVQLTTSEMPAHTHGHSAPSMSILVRKAINGANTVSAGSNTSVNDSTAPNNWAASVSTQSGAQKPHTVTFSAGHEHASVGGGGAHNNMPPYLVVYMWKRTA